MVRSTYRSKPPLGPSFVTKRLGPSPYPVPLTPVGADSSAMVMHILNAWIAGSLHSDPETEMSCTSCVCIVEYLEYWHEVGTSFLIWMMSEYWASIVWTPKILVRERGGVEYALEGTRDGKDKYHNRNYVHNQALLLEDELSEDFLIPQFLALPVLRRRNTNEVWDRWTSIDSIKHLLS